MARDRNAWRKVKHIFHLCGFGYVDWGKMFVDAYVAAYSARQAKRLIRMRMVKIVAGIASQEDIDLLSCVARTIKELAPDDSFKMKLSLGKVVRVLPMPKAQQDESSEPEPTPDTGQLELDFGGRK